MDAPNASRESVLELAARPSAYRTLTVIGLALLSAACGLTEPEPPMMRLQGRVLSREDRRPVSARVQLQHAEGDDDWVFTSYTTVVDASTASDASGWYDLEFRAVTCHSFDLRVEAEGFIPFTLERLPCVDGVQTVNVELDPGVCVPDFFGCKWVPPVAVTLLTPAPGVTIRQNDPSIGCPAHPTRGHGFGISWAAPAPGRPRLPRVRRGGPRCRRPPPARRPRRGSPPAAPRRRAGPPASPRSQASGPRT